MMMIGTLSYPLWVAYPYILMMALVVSLSFTFPIYLIIGPHRLITAVVGALIAATPECCGVVWSDQVARSAKLWLAESRRSFAAFPDYPFTLWLDVLPFRSGAMIAAATKGVAAFVGREIEFETAKLDLPAVIDNVAGLAVYLVEHGAVIKDGSTFGGADEPGRFRVRYANSTRFPGLPVFFCAEPLAS
jgi:hypothetical protein